MIRNLNFLLGNSNPLNNFTENQEKKIDNVNRSTRDSDIDTVAYMEIQQTKNDQNILGKEEQS